MCVQVSRSSESYRGSKKRKEDVEDLEATTILVTTMGNCTVIRFLFFFPEVLNTLWPYTVDNKRNKVKNNSNILGTKLSSLVTH